MRARFTTLLAAAVLGVYLLVVAGATAALADAAAACPTWPLCTPRLDAAVLVALGHRLAAALVGLLVVAAAVLGWRRGTTRRVRAALGVALALYPAQIAVGAVVATSGATGALPTVHLSVGLAIFASLVLALAWQLEAETGTEGGTPGESPAPTDALRPQPGSASSTASPAPSPSGTPSQTPSGTPSQSPSATTSDTPSPTPLQTRSSGSTDEGVRSDDPSGVLSNARRTALAYLRLTKPRLMWLLCLVAAAGMALAAGPGLRVGTVVATLGGGVLAIGASGTFNHVLERDLDRRMARTADRPIPTQQVPARNAVLFGLGLTALSLASFLQVNPLVAALGVAAIVFYSLIYTLVLKPNTVQNTVIGGAAGALPAIIGWVAVTGRFGLPGLALAGVVFLWTPAHFYNLALAYREDYERGGIPMLPVVRGETVTRKHVLLYLAATLGAAAALAALTGLGWLYATTIVLVGGIFLWAVVRLHRERTDGAAMRAFHASNAYLGLLLVAVVVDALVV